MNRFVVAAMTDWHSGHKLGLCNPSTVLPEDDEIGRPKDERVELTSFQHDLWGYYEEDVQRVIDLAGDDDIILVHLGDQTQGDRHTQHLMSSRLADQPLIAYANWKIWWEREAKIGGVVFAKGTGSHVFGEGSAEMLVGQMLNLRYNINTIVRYHGVVSLRDALTIDYAHYGPSTGIRDWTEGNQGYYYLKDAVMKSRRHLGAPVPRVYLRGHRHKQMHVTYHEVWQGRAYQYDLLTVPSYCGLGEYAIKATQSVSYQSYGMCAIEVVDDGRILWFNPLYHTRDVRAWDEIS